MLVACSIASADSILSLYIENLIFFSVLKWTRNFSFKYFLLPENINVLEQNFLTEHICFYPLLIWKVPWVQDWLVETPGWRERTAFKYAFLWRTRWKLIPSFLLCWRMLQLPVYFEMPLSQMDFQHKLWKMSSSISIRGQTAKGWNFPSYKVFS